MDGSDHGPWFFLDDRVVVDAAFTTDGAGVVVSWGAAAVSVSGHPKDAARALGVEALFPAGDHESSVGADMKIAAEHICAVTQRWLQRADGTRIPVRCTIVSLRLESALVGFAWVVQQLSPRRQVDVANDLTSDAASPVAARFAALQQAVAARDEFIATIAHELRNPLTPLLFQVRLAIDRLEQVTGEASAVSAEWTRGQFRRLEQRLHRVLETLDRLLDVSRLSTGRVDLVSERVALADEVCEVLASFEAELAVARCELTTTVDATVVGWWDRVRIHQICRNLISNAIRFGAGRPIEVGVTKDDEWATLTVRDQGIGIAAGQHDAIFERFERGGADRRSGGFGIGLWVVRQLCAAMGGHITVQSRLGDGALFTVRLPLFRERATAASGGVHA